MLNILCYLQKIEENKEQKMEVKTTESWVEEVEVRLLINNVNMMDLNVLWHNKMEICLRQQCLIGGTTQFISEFR